METKKKSSTAKTSSPRYEQAASLNGHSFEELFIDNADPTHTSEVAPSTEPGKPGIHKSILGALDHTDIENQNHGIQNDEKDAEPLVKSIHPK